MAVRNELAYRRLQRQLGEIQVALGLANGVHKAMPGNPDLAHAVRYLLQVKQQLFQAVLKMEAEKAEGVLTFSKYSVG